MKRKHLFEVHDQSWCPTSLRNALTDYLQDTIQLINLYKPIIPLMKRTLRDTGNDEVVDLCSGGGGPWPSLCKALQHDLPSVHITLTDLFPNRGAWSHLERSSKGQLQGHPDPVDATKVPEHLEGMRTFFSSVHHFRPEQVKQILEDAVKNRQTIAIFDAATLHPKTLVGVCLQPLQAFCFGWSIRPFRFSRLFWTYLVPVGPALFWFDGLMSCLRSYRVEDFEELVASLSPEASDYDWSVGVEHGSWWRIPVLYLIGTPKCSTSVDGQG